MERSRHLEAVRNPRASSLDAARTSRRGARRPAAIVTALVLLISIVLMSSTTAHATPASDFSFFGPGSITLNFNEVAHSPGDVITNQYAGFGVSFSPNVWFENTRASLGWDTHTIANFLTGTSTSNPTIDIVFSGVVDGAALQFAANGSNDFQFTALLGGSAVETFSHSQAGCCAPQVLGFENVQFDTLRISHTAGASTFFIADQLTWNVIPEPSTALLLGIGLCILPTQRRRAA